MSGLLIAYLVVWLGVAAYVARLGVEQRRLSRAVDTLRSRIEDSRGAVGRDARAA